MPYTMMLYRHNITYAIVQYACSHSWYSAYPSFLEGHKAGPLWGLWVLQSMTSTVAHSYCLATPLDEHMCKRSAVTHMHHGICCRETHKQGSEECTSNVRTHAM